LQQDVHLLHGVGPFFQVIEDRELKTGITTLAHGQLGLFTAHLQMLKLATACTACQMADSQGWPAALTTSLVHRQEYMA
jgi:hypothetical protein